MSPQFAVMVFPLTPTIVSPCWDEDPSLAKDRIKRRLFRQLICVGMHFSNACFCHVADIYPFRKSAAIVVPGTVVIRYYAQSRKLDHSSGTVRALCGLQRFFLLI